MRPQATQTVLERYMLNNPLWQEGYRAFNQLFGKPLGWVYLDDEQLGDHLIRMDRKDYDAFYAASEHNQKSLEDFLKKYCGLYARSEENLNKFPCFFRDAFGKLGAIFSLIHMESFKGFVILTSLKQPQRAMELYLQPFDAFISSQVELAYRSFELNNFYETVHPRALALSTMHSVHRVISSSLRLNELLPRIGRLSAQVLKASGCSIFLVDPDPQFMTPYFSFGTKSKFMVQNKVRVGRGIVGKIAKTADFYFTRNAIAVPFIDEDVIGVIVLWDKLNRQPFTRTDLDILKSLSEQAVVAIKNAQLYEETEQLTLGSIKTIHELMSLSFSHKKVELPLIVELILAIGRDLDLPEKELVHLERAVMLMDAGALMSPERLFQKKGKLTKREFAQIKQIPLRSANLLKSMKSLRPVIPIISHYRERFDGKGYPQGLKGEEIPIGARIVSVVDSFIAMVSHRAYRASRTNEEAIKEIRDHRGTQFDPHVVDSFLRIVRRDDMTEKIKAVSRFRVAGSHP